MGVICVNAAAVCGLSRNDAGVLQAAADQSAGRCGIPLSSCPADRMLPDTMNLIQIGGVPLKKYINAAFAYAIAAMAGGVFYREFTKLRGFHGRTALAFVHTHLFLLGTVVFLLAALFAARLDLEGQKLWRPFLIVYNLGVTLTSVMLTVRGVVQVLVLAVHPGADAALSGIAGIGHILTGVGLAFLFVCLRRCSDGPDA